MLPGVQVLFAFRLAVPSSARVGDVTPLQQAVLVDPLIHGAFRGSVACAVGSSQLLWRLQAREHRLRAAMRLASAGMVLLVVAMVGVTFVITDVLSGSAAAAVATAAVSGFFVYVWFLTPI